MRRWLALGLVLALGSCNESTSAVAAPDGGGAIAELGAGVDVDAADDAAIGAPDLAAAIDLAPPGDGGGGDGGRDDNRDGGRPVHRAMAIDHIVIIVKENHTFDNYFGSFPGADGTTKAPTSKGLITVGRPPLILTRDLCHTHDCALADWNGGKLDNWDVGDTRNASDQLAYAQYIEADIPRYWQYARKFTLLDHFFSSMLGPSFPGHSFALSAQAGWALGNPTQPLPWGCDDLPGTTVDVLDHGTCTVKQVFPCFTYPTIQDLLPSEITWKFYGSRLPPLVGEVWSMFDSVDGIRNTALWGAHVVPETDFDNDVKNGTLPNISFLVPQDQNSEHPPLNVCTGENWTVGHINALMSNPTYWPTKPGRPAVAILFTYDDFGGWYDHVAPPRQYGCDAAHPYGLGFRLPAIILSPYAKPGYVMKRVAHQASIPKMIETVFALPSLASIDPEGAAQDGPDTDDLMDAFDFAQMPNPPLTFKARNCLGQR
jgi:phospholipase C